SAQLLSVDEKLSDLWADRQYRRRARAELRDLLQHAGHSLPQLRRSAPSLRLGADRLLRRREDDVLKGIETEVGSGRGATQPLICGRRRGPSPRSRPRKRL